MKRFWLVLLSLGLVLAFSASAMAVDVKFSGSYYAAGMYLDKTNFLKDTASDGISTAFYYQRLRVQTDFIVSPGLKLVTRFDALERAWGASRSTSSATALDADTAGTTLESENIAFDLAYVQWQSPIGYFMVGYQDDGSWGTLFGDSSAPLGKVQFVTQAGPVVLAAYAGKVAERNSTAKASSVYVDRDVDKYVATATYNVNKDISAGFLYVFYNYKLFKAVSVGAGPLSNNGGAPVSLKAHAVNPYAKAKFGPISLEAELLYAFGTAAAENNIGNADVSVSILTAYLGGVADFGPAYVGGVFAYMSGDDPATTDRIEGGYLGGGYDWNPCLIMFNRDVTVWAGTPTGVGGASAANTNSLLGAMGMNNAWFGQGYIGGRPTPALDIKLSLAYATADKKPSNYINSNYGYEVDVTGTYKITNNLSYMLGFGYWFVGDYFKGTSTTASVKDEYLLINKLTLTF